MRNIRFFIFLVLAVLAVSCSQTRYVPQQKYLVDRVRLEIDNPSINKEEARSFLQQKENYKILGFVKFYLMLYNLSSKKKPEGWLKRIGEAPQLYDEVLVRRSKEQLEKYLAYKGFYRAQVMALPVFNEKKQKVELTFKVQAGQQYTIREVNYHFVSPELHQIFVTDSARVALRTGMPFDIYYLQKKQKEIAKLYRDNGYYYFAENQVRYFADTLRYPTQVVLDLFVGETRSSALDSVRILSPYHVRDFYFQVLPGNAPLNNSTLSADQFADTLEWDHSHLYLNHQIKYPPELFERTNKMKSGDLYRVSAVENTFNAFSRLQQFRFVDIYFQEAESSLDTNWLDCYVRLAPLNKQSTSFEVEGTNTAGDLGVAGNIYYQHRNLFRGAEIFQLRLRGATERMHRTVSGNSQYFHTKELGVESNLVIPRLLGPGRYIQSFDKYLPTSVLNVGYNYQRRPEYTRTITNLRFGYDWKSSRLVKNQWSILDMNLVRLSRFDADFVNSIQDLYIKSSFTDHFIFASNYSYIYNNQGAKNSGDYTYLRFNAESAGNVLYALSKMTSSQSFEAIDSVTGQQTSYFKFLGTRYAQYLKADIEVRRGISIDKYNTVVGRVFLGVGFPYGNFDLMPFEKQYFSGGANGIRAWQVRSLGPGTYKAPDGAYPNQSSDIKLEANLEYRFHLFSSLEGALFLDAGNIWAINDKDNRPGARFYFDQFYKEIAVGTGAGFRFDFDYFLLRFDLGLKLRDPANEEGNRWIIGSRPFTGNDLAFSFAIGYPF